MREEKVSRRKRKDGRRRLRRKGEGQRGEGTMTHFEDVAEIFQGSLQQLAGLPQTLLAILRLCLLGVQQACCQAPPEGAVAAAADGR